MHDKSWCEIYKRISHKLQGELKINFGAKNQMSCRYRF